MFGRGREPFVGSATAGNLGGVTHAWQVNSMDVTTRRIDFTERKQAGQFTRG